MEFRITRRLAEEASTPAYQAVTRVRSMPKARMAMVMPRIVSPVRSLWRKALRMRSLRVRIVQVALVQVADHLGRLGGLGVVGHHDDGLARFAAQPAHQRHDLFG